MAAVPQVGRAHTGSSQTTHQLYEQYGRSIYAYCLHRLRSKEEAEDAVQTTFLNAFRSLEKGTETQFEQAWLFKIAQNVCLERSQSSARRVRLEAPSDLHVLQETAPAHETPDPEQLIGIEDALAGMPANQRKAILLREWQGLSYKEIGEELGLSQSSVEMLLFRARRSLAAALEQPRVEQQKKRRSGGRALNVGSLVTALKTLFTGGAAVKAVAVAVSVGTVAVIGSKPAVHHLLPVKHVKHRVSASAAPGTPVGTVFTQSRGGPGLPVAQAHGPTARAGHAAATAAARHAGRARIAPTTSRPVHAARSMPIDDTTPAVTTPAPTAPAAPTGPAVAAPATPAAAVAPSASATPIASTPSPAPPPSRQPSKSGSGGSGSSSGSTGAGDGTGSGSGSTSGGSASGGSGSGAGDGGGHKHHASGGDGAGDGGGHKQHGGGGGGDGSAAGDPGSPSSSDSGSAGGSAGGSVGTPTDSVTTSAGSPSDDSATPTSAGTAAPTTGTSTATTAGGAGGAGASDGSATGASDSGSTGSSGSDSGSGGGGHGHHGGGGGGDGGSAGGAGSGDGGGGGHHHH